MTGLFIKKGKLWRIGRCSVHDTIIRMDGWGFEVLGIGVWIITLRFREDVELPQRIRSLCRDWAEVAQRANVSSVALYEFPERILEEIYRHKPVVKL